MSQEQQSQNKMSKAIKESMALLKGEKQTRFLSRSILLEEAGPPRAVFTTVTLCAFLVFGFLVWAAIVQLDEKTAAPGEILPINFVQPVQHLEGGIVAQILVQDGDDVKAGDPLVVMDDTAFLADLDRMRTRHAALTLQEERLRAFALDRTLDYSAFVEGFGELRDDQAAVFEAQSKARDAQLSVVRSQIEERRNELDGLKQQEAMLSEQVDLVAEEVSLRGELVEKGLSSKLIYLGTKRELSRTQAELAQVRSNQARTRANLAESESRYLELESRLRNDALSELSQISSERQEVAEELKRLEDKVSRLMVTAPVDGTVNGLTVKSVGSVLAPGALVAEVVPNQRELVAEVRISPQDVGHVKVGKPALVKVETYDFARYGGIEGKVSHVSAASFLDEEGQPYFKGRVSLERNFVGPEQANYILTPGMTLVADIKTGEKSLMGYLVRPVYNALGPAFSER